jgi:hypothetical protein
MGDSDLCESRKFREFREFRNICRNAEYTQ